MIKNLTAHKKDEDAYKWRLLGFKKAFPNVLYKSFDSLKSFSPMNEANITKGNGVT
jgi:hypothetical protein